jgi:cellulose biosynthesis protein BcsQ
MATIALTSPKGGAGMSTSTALLGSDLAERGTTVTVIDADPNHPLACRLLEEVEHWRDMLRFMRDPQGYLRRLLSDE